MPPKSPSTTWPPRRRTSQTTAEDSTLNSNSATIIHLRPPTSTAPTATVAVPFTSTAFHTSSEPSQETICTHPTNADNSLQVPTHATTPASLTQSQVSQKTLASNSGHANFNYKESGKSFDLENFGVEHLGPEKIIHDEAATVLGNGDGSKNGATLSSLPVERPNAQDESAAVAVAGSGNGKRKLVRKTVRVVKKVIKKRIPKRVIMNGSENPGVVVKAEDGVNLSEVRKKSNLANVVIEKSNVVDEVMEKTGIVNEVEDMLSMMNDLAGNPNIVNEKSGLGNKATEKTSVVDEVTEKANITDDAMQNPKLVSTANVSRPIIGERDNYLNGIAHMESVRSKNDQSGINTTVTYNIDSNVVSEVDRKDKTICAPDLIEDEKVDYAPGTITGSEIKMENQSEDFVVEHVKTGIINKVDVELLAGENVSPIREKNVVLDGAKSGRMFGKAESSSEVESDCIRSTEGLLLSGEMEALERKKRRKTEIFLRGLDKDMKEDDIRKTFGEAGPIVEVRLLMSKRGKSRGFAFVRFATYADAKNALEKYSKICGKQCTAAPVEGNDTIFLGNIDRNWKTEDVMTLVEKAGVLKIDKITIKADPDNFDKNRGFAFVELQTSKDAQIAFNKLQKKNAFGKNQTVKVSWALPLTEPNDEEISRVKSVYAEYLPSSWDEEKVKDYFKRFGEIENIVLAKDLPSSRRKDFAFINYTARDAALMCIEAVSRERLEDDCSKVKMAVSLAKPISKRKQMKHTSDKHLSKAKQKAFQKLHEPRDKGKAPRTSYYHKKVDKKPSTTDELVQILRQQASTKHIPSQPRTGTTVSDHHFSLPGSKRPFSLVGHDPLYVECQGFSELRVERSYPIPGPSSSSYGVELLSFPYHHRQGPSVASESGSAREIYPNHFQAREQAPYYADNNIYRRY